MLDSARIDATRLAHEVLDSRAMREVVPASVRELLREHVQTLEQLEILLLLHDESAHLWAAGELAAHLNVGEVLVGAALAHLTERGLLAVEAGRYHYAPREPKLRSAVELLARCHQAMRPELLALLASDAMGRVRGRMRQLRDRLKN